LRKFVLFRSVIILIQTDSSPITTNEVMLVALRCSGFEPETAQIEVDSVPLVLQALSSSLLDSPHPIVGCVVLLRHLDSFTELRYLTATPDAFIGWVHQQLDDQAQSQGIAYCIDLALFPMGTAVTTEPVVVVMMHYLHEQAEQRAPWLSNLTGQLV
jgi:hypothetical protein